jgi:polyisoprenoid-binding protein YceI
MNQSLVIFRLFLSSLLPALVSALLIGSVNLQAATFTKIDNTKSAIDFTSKQMGVAVDGNFKKFEVNVTLDPEKVESAKGWISIDLASINTGSKEGNDEVQGKNWFGVKTFPNARFDLKSIKSTGNGHLTLTGDLNIKGKTKSISTDATLKVNGNTALLDGKFTFKRLDFSIGEGPWGDVDVVANDVNIHYKLLLK